MKKHNWQPTDTEGHSYDCADCGAHYYAFDENDDTPEICNSVPCIKFVHVWFHPNGCHYYYENKEKIEKDVAERGGTYRTGYAIFGNGSSIQYESDGTKSIYESLKEVEEDFQKILTGTNI